MSDRRRTALAIVAGAAVGGIVGYVLFTENGRRLRARLEPAIGDTVRELGGVAGTIGVLKMLASEGRRVWTELAPDRVASSGWETPIRQQNPF